MSMKIRGSLTLAIFSLLSGCQSGPLKSAEDTCSVVPPDVSEQNRKAAAEAAVDLTKLAKLPLSANFKAELSNTFRSTFQKVPDAAAACAMLNQTYVCIRDSERAKTYMEFMRETKQCSRN